MAVQRKEFRIISGQTFDEERALYGVRNALIEDCRFEGPDDGESALKESSDVKVRGCGFSLHYPLWHVTGFSMTGCDMEETCRAPLWYSRDGSIDDCRIDGVKCLRECDDVSIHGCSISSPEFGWKCRGITVSDSHLTSEYAFLDSSSLKLDGVEFSGKYSFQYTEDVTIRNCTLSTKDAFWHSRNVTVEDSIVKGEYLGWYSENLTLVRCRIIGTQPLCYCRNLRLVDCTMEGTDLSFERSEVDAAVIGHIDSVKNPLSGSISAGSIGEVVLDGCINSSCRISVPGNGTSGNPETAESRCRSEVVQTTLRS